MTVAIERHCRRSDALRWFLMTSFFAPFCFDVLADPLKPFRAMPLLGLP